MSKEFEQMKQFVLKGVKAQKAADEIIEKINNEKRLAEAAEKAKHTGELKPYLDLRRKLLPNG